MKKNMGTTDRILRVVVAIVIVILYVGQIISGTMAAVLLILSGVFLLTGFMSVCPLYMPFGISTKGKN